MVKFTVPMLRLPLSAGLMPLHKTAMPSVPAAAGNPPPIESLKVKAPEVSAGAPPFGETVTPKVRLLAVIRRLKIM